MFDERGLTARGRKIAHTEGITIANWTYEGPYGDRGRRAWMDSAFGVAVGVAVRVARRSSLAAILVFGLVVGGTGVAVAADLFTVRDVPVDATLGVGCFRAGGGDCPGSPATPWRS